MLNKVTAPPKMQRFLLGTGQDAGVSGQYLCSGATVDTKVTQSISNTGRVEIKDFDVCGCWLKNSPVRLRKYHTVLILRLLRHRFIKRGIQYQHMYFTLLRSCPLPYGTPRISTGTSRRIHATYTLGSLSDAIRLSTTIWNSLEISKHA